MLTGGQHVQAAPLAQVDLYAGAAQPAEGVPCVVQVDLSAQVLLHALVLLTVQGLVHTAWMQLWLLDST